MANPDFQNMACPLPLNEYPRIVMAHGGGGRLMRRLVNSLFAAAFSRGDGVGDSPAEHDGASFVLGGNVGRIALTTDSYVVRPLFFPGGSIATLAIHGTVNDLAMCGAEPIALSSAFVLEEGLSTETLWRVAREMRLAADAAGVIIATGDTKVVERGKCDSLYITTSGIGRAIAPSAPAPAPQSIRPGDVVILSGDIGRHGIAILAARAEIPLEVTVESDCACLLGPVRALYECGAAVHCLRDCTRGGVASSLVELAEDSRTVFHVDESKVEVRDDVRAACELLGFDPLQVANEGRFVAFVPEADADRALQALSRDPVSSGARVIGRVASADARQRPGTVLVRGVLGTHRILDMLSGEQLPRIC